MTDVPTGVAIETVWAIEADYAPDAIERRAPVRAAHLARIAELQRQGTIIAAGAFADASGSLILARLPDEAAARALVEGDVYWSAGVWTGCRVRPFGLVRLAGDEAATTGAVPASR
jgi:hypothetical protein